MDLRDNFKSRCPVRYNSDGTHWYCKRQLSEKQEIENKTCNYSRCPGRELTEEEETARLLEIESKMKDTKKEVKKDPMDALMRRMKRELERIEAEELNFKKCDFKVNDKNKWFCKKNMDSALPMEDKECYRDGCPGRKATYEEEKEENVRKENVKKELKALEKKTASKKPIEQVKPVELVEPALLPTPVELAKPAELGKPVELVEPAKAVKQVKAVKQTKPIEQVKAVELAPPVEQEIKVEPVLKKCEWHICPNYFEFGKKEKFCCERCRRKDNRLKSRRRCALRKKEISTKGL